MYNKSQLEERSIDELRAIAKAMNISKISRLTAQEIVYKILDSQAKEEAKTTEQENTAVAVKKPSEARVTRDEVSGFP